MLSIGYVIYHYTDLLYLLKAAEALGSQRLVTSSHEKFCLLPQCDINCISYVLHDIKTWNFGVEKESVIVQKVQWYVIADLG